MSILLLLLFDVVWVDCCPTLRDELERAGCYPGNIRTTENCDIGMIVVYCIVRLFEGGDICQDQRINPEQFNTTESCCFEGSAGNFTAGNVIDMHDIITRFDPRGWLVAIPLLTYPFLLHHSIPSFTHPIGKKKYLWPFILCTYIFLECVSFVWVLLSPCGLRLKLKNQLS